MSVLTPCFISVISTLLYHFSEWPLRRLALAACVVLTLVDGAFAEEASLDQAAVCTFLPKSDPQLTLVGQKRITLACLLGGVPAIALLMALVFCLYIGKRKKQLRKHALANGIELDEEGWPVHHTRVALTPIKAPPSKQRETRSYSSSAGDFKAPSLDAGNPYSPRYNRGSAPAGPSMHPPSQVPQQYRPSTTPSRG